MKALEITWKHGIIYLFLGAFLVSCGGANRNLADDPEYREMVEKVSDLEFEIENEWANPTQYSRVNLFGNPNYVRFEDDSVKVYLPFFGERYAGGAYDNDEGAIQYEGIPQNLEIQQNPEKGAVNISFEGNRSTENLEFLITVYSGGVARTTVTSSQRETISYDGKLIER